MTEYNLATAFSKVNRRWTLMGDASEVRRTDERGTILEVLLDATEPLSPKDIKTASEMARNGVDQLLYKMGKSGEVMKAARGLYIHPKRSDFMR